MAKLIKGVNDLETLKPELCKEWNYTKNGDLKPSDFTVCSGKEVFWILPYDDPITGKHFDFEWPAQISCRSRGNGCPYLSNHAVWYGFNDLETWCKINNRLDILEEWDYDKNKLTPREITPKTNDKYSFKCSIGHSYEQGLYRKTIENAKCPYCLNRKVLAGYNDLATTNKYLAAEWNYKKNKEEHSLNPSHPLTPNEITANNKTNVWWILPYDDPITGKHFDFEWPARIQDRNNGNGCPYLSGQKIWPGFNDLKTWCELNNRIDILNEWDYELNDFAPTEVAPNAHRHVHFKCKYGHKYEQSLDNKIGQNKGCPICSNHTQISFPEKTIFFYLSKKFPDTIENYKADWLGKMEIDIFIPSLNVGIEYDGGHYHENNKVDSYKNQLCKNNNVILIRVREPDCPKIDNCIVYKLSDKKKSSLESVIKNIFMYLNIYNMDIDIERDSIKIQENIMKYNLQNSFEAWCIQNNHPEYLEEWDQEKNGKISPSDIFRGTKDKYYFLCKYGHSYKQAIKNKTTQNQGCPYCSGRRPNEKTRIDLWCKNNNRMDILNLWDYTKNKVLPNEISYGSGKYISFICENGHSFKRRMSVATRSKKFCCPECKKSNKIKDK